uniref:hypothetical protein n=1 Tax=Hassallia byssoidea TaxID=482630 RepID=UPI001F2C1A92|nr:hypothetical protein [Hassalia byssoidea]
MQQWWNVVRDRPTIRVVENPVSYYLERFTKILGEPTASVLLKSRAGVLPNDGRCGTRREPPHGTAKPMPNYRLPITHYLINPKSC